MKRVGFLIALMFVSLAGFSAPLSGAYTIGGASPDYPAISDAVAALSTDGVNGPVIFNIRSGTYTEQVLVNTVAGASATNTIIFQSETGTATDVVMQYATDVNDNYVIRLNAAGFITIRNMTLKTISTDIEHGTVLDLVDKGDNITITGNIISGLPGVTWSGLCHVILAVSFNGKDLRIANNTVNYGSIGICLTGKDANANAMTGAVVQGNKVNDFFGWGISANYMKNASIEANEITTTTNPTYSVISIYLQNNSFPVCVVKNKIVTYGNGGNTGMYIVNNHPTTAANGMLIANNSIISSNAYALMLINNDYSKFYNNSVRIANTVSCFTVYGNSVGNVLANNIFYQAGMGHAISIAPGSVSSCNYNLLYTAGLNIGQWNNNNCSNLAAWQTASGMDANSVVISAPFVSATDLHLTAYSALRFGVQLAEVKDDIDYNPRTNTPVVGADEEGTVVVISSSCCACTGPAFTSDRTTVCAGGTVNFTDISAFTSNSWRWSFPGASPNNSSIQNPAVTYTTAGTYDVKMVVTSVSGADSIIKAGYITVTSGGALGAITAEPDTLCAGGTALLRVTGSAGIIRWQWYTTPGTYVDLTGVSDTNYTTPALTQSTGYRWIVGSGNCADTSADVMLIVNPLPVAPSLTLSDSIICASDSALINTSGTYTSYQWNNGDRRNFTYGKSAGGYWVTVTDANGCTAVSARKQLAIYPVPSVSIVVQGDTLTSFSASAYQWYLNDSVIQGATNPVYIAEQPGQYAVQITDSNGCKTRSTNIDVAVTGIELVTDLPGLYVYPNPFSNTIHIRCEAGMNIEAVTGYDVLGKTVPTRVISLVGNVLTVDMGQLPSGIYFLKLSAMGHDYLQKMIKK